VNHIRVLALLVTALAAVVIPVSVASADLLVRDYQPVGPYDPHYDRFANSSDFIGAGLDFSGVGQDASSPARWATMISPHFFLSAGHFPPSGTVTFYDTNSLTGGTHSASVLAGTKIYIAGQTLPTDVYLGVLDGTVSEAYYPLLDPNSLSAGQPIFVYGKPNRLGTNVISEIGQFDLGVQNPDHTFTTLSTQIGFDYFYNETGNPGDAQLELYDSGGPSFVTINNKLVLVGTHSGADTADGYPYVSFDTSPSFYINEINAAMASLAGQYGVGAGEQVTVVPEPSALVLLGVAAVGIVGYYRRRG
jgi:hypothetical protein